MRTARGEPQNHVAFVDRRAVDDLILFNDTHREAREVVFPFGVHARHFGGFTADEGAAREFAALGDARDDAGGDVHVELAAGVVVEEEEALGALHENVVHAHGDEVLAHGVVAAEAEGEHKLRSHAVGARDENGVLVFLAHFEESAEAADGAENARNEGALGGGFDAFDEFVSGVDRHAGSCVGELGHCLTNQEKRGGAGFVFP